MEALSLLKGSSKDSQQSRPHVTEPCQDSSNDDSEAFIDHIDSQVSYTTPNSALGDVPGEEKGIDTKAGSEVRSDGSAKTGHGPVTNCQSNELSENDSCSNASLADLWKQVRILESQLSVTLDQLEAEKGRVKEITHENQELKIERTDIEKNLNIAYHHNGRINGELDELKHKHNELIQNYNDLHRKFEKKDGNYKKLTKDYMELVRPIHISDGDHPTIHNRLTSIRVMIENLIQNATKDNYANVDKEAAIQFFKRNGCFEGLPIPEANLEFYHLELYVEALIMSTLVNCFFGRHLRCVLDLSEKFEEIYWWVYRRDSKMAIRWRQQLCALAAQDTEAMEVRRDQEVSTPVLLISELVHTVYSNVDMSLMSTKVKELCCSAFDLNFTMVRIESTIFPESSRFGMPFDSENMETPRKSNTAGNVSLMIFPAFIDREGNFKTKSKVWCY
ncbi:hypothetical protein BGX27_003149 [Mortierella sp. AM989]|nr:hypothetical protein BGX27_003149 [Mortierella sp. AM989]